MTLEDFHQLEETLHDHVDPHCFLKEKCIECVLDAMKECVERERIKAKKLLEAVVIACDTMKLGNSEWAYKCLQKAINEYQKTQP